MCSKKNFLLSLPAWQSTIFRLIHCIYKLHEWWSDIILLHMYFFFAADTTGLESVYTVYEGHEVMFHVSTLLPYTPDNRQQVRAWRHHETVTSYQHFPLDTALLVHVQRYWVTWSKEIGKILYFFAKLQLSQKKIIAHLNLIQLWKETSLDLLRRLFFIKDSRN